jgi:hypothetical protein
MKKLFFVICLVLLQIMFDGCCQLEPPPYGYSVKIDLLYKSTGRTLIASRDSLYYPDSILLETGNPVRRYNLAVNTKDTILRSNYIYPEGLNFDTLYFRYRITKVDTIIVYYHKETGKACGERFAVLEIDKTVVNGNTVCEPCNDLREPLLIRK